MKREIRNEETRLCNLSIQDLIKIEGGVVPVVPIAIAVAAPVVGVYVGLCGLAYYSGYAAHALYDLF